MAFDKPVSLDLMWTELQIPGTPDRRRFFAGVAQSWGPHIFPVLITYRQRLDPAAAQYNVEKLVIVGLN